MQKGGYKIIGPALHELSEKYTGQRNDYTLVSKIRQHLPRCKIL
jgi:hypothetical protein